MPGRRHVLASGWMLLAGLCGCAGRNDGLETVPVEAFDYELSNQLDDPATTTGCSKRTRDSVNEASLRVSGDDRTQFDLSPVGISKAVRLHVLGDGESARVDLRELRERQTISVLYDTLTDVPGKLHVLLLDPDDCGRSSLQQRSVARAGRVVGPELGPKADGTLLL